MFAVSAPVDCEPLVALLPDHAPDAVQLVALVVLHASVELPPLATAVGLAARVTLGAAGASLTVTETLLVILPPAPVQASE